MLNYLQPIIVTGKGNPKEKALNDAQIRLKSKLWIDLISSPMMFEIIRL
jgi:hypothetical protein